MPPPLETLNRYSVFLVWAVHAIYDVSGSISSVLEGNALDATQNAVRN